MMRKIILILPGLLFFISCSAVKERLAIRQCKFFFVSVKPYNFTYHNFSLDFTLKGENPNRVDAVLDRFTYTFFINETAIFSGKTGEGLRIPANKSKNFKTTLVLEYNKLGDALIEAIRLKKADYKIKARVYIKTILGDIGYPVEIKNPQ